MAKTSKSSQKTSSMAPGWWGKDAMDLSSIDVDACISGRATKDARFKKMQGSMLLFRAPLYFKVIEASLISPVDENGKVCIRLDEEEYDFLSKLEECMITKMIEPKVSMLGTSPEMKRSVVMSEGTGLPYMKSKIQTLGYSRTTGIGADGKECLDTPSLLETQGSCGDFLMRIEGVYITQQNCGVLMKVDMFRLKSVPSVEDVEEARSKREEEAKKFKEKRLLSFMGGDAKRTKK